MYVHRVAFVQRICALFNFIEHTMCHKSCAVWLAVSKIHRILMIRSLRNLAFLKYWSRWSIHLSNYTLTITLFVSTWEPEKRCDSSISLCGIQFRNFCLAIIQNSSQHDLLLVKFICFSRLSATCNSMNISQKSLNRLAKLLKARWHKARARWKGVARVRQCRNAGQARR